MGQAIEELAKLEGLDLSSDDVSYLTGDSSGPEHSEYTAVDPKGRRVSIAEGERFPLLLISGFLTTGTYLAGKFFKAHGITLTKHTSHDYVEFCNLHHMFRVILDFLDDFTNNGLHCVAKVLTEDRSTFEKTRLQMEKVIRKSLDFCKTYNALAI
ncbi:hypothetical protein Cgig2_033783 [Carnegiea gigantea]|uniref:Uncharacterized protein n=1 Tax=Carnegiea gigantea TaxID=171969 RepID=A0A9Q1QHJ3_9CARY|nr:hypothetical protein Cgig2_033783 [Carnegiea gigantea]